MALGLNFGDGGVAGDGDSLLTAFTSINNMFSTTTKLSNGDLEINGVNIGKANNSSTTRVGEGALNVNTGSGNNNTAVGQFALSLNTIGVYNTAIGSNTLKENISNSNNTAVGLSSLERTKGNSNTAIGVSSLTNNVGGQSNVAIGVSALVNSISVSNNTAIGSNSGAGNTLYSNCTALGANASFLNGDNQVQLGDSTTTTYVYNTVQSRSDLRDKAEVRDTILGLDFINELRPVDYKWDMREDYRSEMPNPLELDATEEEKDAHKILMDEWIESCKPDNLTHDGTYIRSRFHHGLIAQEVQDLIEASGVDFGGFQDHKVSGGGDILSIGYDELIAPMIKAIQELTARINVLENN